MSEKIMLDNKYVEVNGNGYRLTINKTIFNRYIAYLSSTETSFSSNVYFDTCLALEADLRKWIIKVDGFNNSEDVIFDRLSNWDGVIET